MRPDSNLAAAHETPLSAAWPVLHFDAAALQLAPDRIGQREVSGGARLASGRELLFHPFGEPLTLETRILIPVRVLGPRCEVEHAVDRREGLLSAHECVAIGPAAIQLGVRAPNEGEERGERFRGIQVIEERGSNLLIRFLGCVRQLGGSTARLGQAIGELADPTHRLNRRLERERLVEWVEGKLAQRRAARAARDFALADAIRRELEARGVEVKDGPGGTEWRLREG